MPLKLRIASFRGVPEAALDITDAITLIAGPNGAGKSSICDALCSLLRGPTYVPLDLAKKECGALVRAGATEAMLELFREADGAKRMVTWPSGKFLAEGPPIEASEYALGLKSIVDYPDDTQTGLRARATMLAPYLKSQPTKEELKKELDTEKVDLSEAGRERVWERLCQGDEGWRKAVTAGQTLKGEWRGITGQEYGSREGARWQPPGWTPDLEPVSEDSLTAAVVEARQATEAALALNAVDEAARERLTATAGQVDDLRKQLEAAEKELADFEKLSAEAREKARTPKPAGSKGEPGALIYTCAYTGKPEMLHAGSLVQVDAEQRQSEQAAIGNWEAMQAAAQTQALRVSAAQRKVASIKSSIEASNLAKEQIAKLPARVDNEKEVELARQNETTAEQRLDVWRKKTNADRIHGQITTNQQIVAILAPEGLRQKALARALDEFNAELKDLSTAASWRTCMGDAGIVKLDQDFMPRFGNFQFRLLSASEQFRVRVTLQLAIARREKAPLVVIDRADVLDGRDDARNYLGGRNGLVAMLIHAQIPAVVAMTLHKPEECPDLTRLGGRSYWLAAA